MFRQDDSDPRPSNRGLLTAGASRGGGNRSQGGSGFHGGALMDLRHHRKPMSQTIKSNFATRRDAELAIEHLVQEHGVERTDIFVAPLGGQNSAGEAAPGSDLPSASPGEEDRTEGALNGRIEVSVDLRDDDQASAVRAVFQDLGGSDT